MTTSKECVGECPKCGYELLSYEEIQIQDNSASYPYYCGKCGTRGEEVYIMSYLETTVEE